MNERNSLILSLDMFRIPSGEILTSYGNYAGQTIRARLSFYPAASGRMVGNMLLRKTTYETDYRIQGFEKILDLPGEQHFLVDRSSIGELYRPRDAFQHVPASHREAHLSFIKFLKDFCGIDERIHGLAGSGALRCILPASDLDWIVYAAYSQKVKDCIVTQPACEPDLTFTMHHVFRKYSHFIGFDRLQLSALFTDRWKYFRYRGIPFSLSFVDPTLRADPLLGKHEFGVSMTLRGVVTNPAGSYQIPRIIPVKIANNKMVNVLTWLFLYNGAVGKGDEIEVSGRYVEIGGQEYLLVERSVDYIRNLSAERRQK